MTSLVANGVEINRDLWIKDGEESEKSGSVETCQAIMYDLLNVGCTFPTYSD